MEKIYFKKTNYIEEEKEFKVENSHNCFLKGQTEYANVTEYLAVYETEKHLMIVEIKNQKDIKMNNYRNKSYGTLCDISEFLRTHNNVKEVNRQMFQNELNSILELLEEK